MASKFDAQKINLPLRSAIQVVVEVFDEKSYTAFDQRDEECTQANPPVREFYGWCDKGCNTLLEYFVPVKAVRIHFCAELEESCKEMAGNLLLINGRYNALLAKGYPSGELSKEEFVKKWRVNVFSVNTQSHLEKIVCDVQQIMSEVTIQGVHYP